MSNFLLLDLLVSDTCQGGFETGVRENDKGEQVSAYICSSDPTLYLDADTLDTQVFSRLYKELMSEEMIKRIIKDLNELLGRNSLRISEEAVRKILDQIENESWEKAVEFKKATLAEMLDRVEITRKDKGYSVGLFYKQPKEAELEAS